MYHITIIFEIIIFFKYFKNFLLITSQSFRDWMPLLVQGSILSYQFIWRRSKIKRAKKGYFLIINNHNYIFYTKFCTWILNAVNSLHWNHLLFFITCTFFIYIFRNIKNTQKLNEQELQLGLIGKKSWHDEYKDSAWLFIGGLPYDLSEGDVICVFSQ